MGDMTGQPRRLGLVLGGTGVRGLCSAGVVGAFERSGLAPDVVVGVSTAAIVAATYASRPDWSEALQGIDRRRLPSTAGVAHDEMFARLRGTLRSARQLAPSVWTWGRQGYESFSRQSLEDLVGADQTFAQSRIPLALVATDLTEGSRAVIDDGPLAVAALAASALPGVTRPVSHRGRLLVDGAFSDPAPVDVARRLGADVVVALAPLGHSPPRGDDPEGPVTGLLRGIELGQRAFVEERLADADVALRPNLGPDVRLLDFASLDDATRRAASEAAGAAARVRKLLADAPVDRSAARRG